MKNVGGEWALQVVLGEERLRPSAFGNRVGAIRSFSRKAPHTRGGKLERRLLRNEEKRRRKTEGETGDPPDGAQGVEGAVEELPASARDVEGESEKPRPDY